MSNELTSDMADIAVKALLMRCHTMVIVDGLAGTSAFNSEVATEIARRASLGKQHEELNGVADLAERVRPFMVATALKFERERCIGILREEATWIDEWDEEEDGTRPSKEAAQFAKVLLNRSIQSIFDSDYWPGDRHLPTDEEWAAGAMQKGAA